MKQLPATLTINNKTYNLVRQASIDDKTGIEKEALYELAPPDPQYLYTPTLDYLLGKTGPELYPTVRIPIH